MPSSTRYAAPISLTTVNATADAASSPATPTDVTTAQAATPAAIPAAAAIPARRPEIMALRMTTRKSGPGDMAAIRTTPPRASD
jgi:hypothetical protein